MYKINGLSSVSLFNKSTGEEVLKANGILDKSIIAYELGTEFDIDNNLNFNIKSFGGSISGTLDYINPEYINILCPEVKDQIFKINMEGYHEFQLQKRHHKKKRINKKWAKRYGYDTKQVKVEYMFNRCKFNTDKGEFEILAEL